MQKVRKNKQFDYKIKFASYKNKTLFEKLDKDQQLFISEFSFRYKLTFQEFRQVVEAARDLAMWRENPLSHWYQASFHPVNDDTPGPDKRTALKNLQQYMAEKRQSEKDYDNFLSARFKERNSKKITTTRAGENFYGMCPVASPKTVCCNLRTIDAVENCTFGCSYCTIQTFYTEDIRVNDNLAERLATIKIEPGRYYHFGTGQSSDSLAYGDRGGIITAHCRFAAQHPNILMEFKTKSKNISYFVENEIPENVVCSWSLNPQTIISNEEHFTASLDERLASARKLADRGIKIAFHFHPMVYYSGWEKEYTDLARRVTGNFSANEVLFVSLGSVTLIKPVIQKIRDLGNPSKILQMDFVADPHGKYTYPDQTKIDMFTSMYQAFSTWHGEVFFYLCMEKSDIWMGSLGYVFQSNDQFEQEFGRSVMAKIADSMNQT